MARKTLLQLTQSFCRLKGLPLPVTVVGNGDPAVQQILELQQRFLSDMLLRGMWQSTLAEATFVSVAGETQGSIHTICPFGYQGIVPDTFFDRTVQRQVEGAMTSNEWGWQHARLNAGPLFRYAVRGDQLLLSPNPPANHTLAFEYYSDFFVKSSTGVRQDSWQADSDFCLFPDHLPAAFLLWAYKKEKGFDYAEDFATYEKLVSTLSNRQNLGRTVNLSTPANLSPGPGIFIPNGSWPLR